MKMRQRKKTSKCKRLRIERDNFRGEMNRAKADAEMFKKRLFVLGLDENLEYLPGLSLPTLEEEIPIDTMQWGNWAAVLDDCDRFIDDITNRLASSLVRGLIQQNIVRIIIKEPGDFFNPIQGWGTVAVKLTVVPWEQVTSRRLIYKGGQYERETGSEAGSKED